MKGLKTGGRKAGTPNKKTEEIFELSKELNIDPLKVLFLIAGGKFDELGFKDEDLKKISPGYRLTLLYQAASDLMSYMYPKRKAVEIRNEDPVEPPSFTINLTPPKSED